VPVKTPRLLLPLAALVAALLLAPAALAAPAATKLSLSGPDDGAAANGKATVTATLSAGGKPLAARPVALFAGGAAPLATGPTSAKGKVSFEVTITAPTQLQATFTPSAADAPAYAAAKSNTITVAPTVAIGLSIESYLHAGHKAVGIPRQRVKVSGTLNRFTPGQAVQIDVFKDTRNVKRRALAVTKAGGKGRFAFNFEPGGRGVYRLRASVPGGTGSTRLYVVSPNAGVGASGTAVRALQSRLAALGYLINVSGHYDSTTGRAVLAFRKVNGYARTTGASSAVFKKLARGGGGYRVRYPNAGKHAEFDWSRQVLVLARGARPVKIVPASSGKPSTPTVFGKFHFYSKTPGFNSHGMYYSNYFVGGYAIHGYAEVPDYAASHGCIRIPIPSAISVYRWVSIGDPMYVYR
jgi:L,D-transpeptidase catalytic domain/Putative peptidoglycan binding domain